ncbi:hypothetical protein D3C83_73250 [compost metagenome]
MRSDEGPIDFDTEAGAIVEIDVALAYLCALLEQAEPHRIPIGRAVGFDAAAAARKSRNQMGVQLRRMMRRDLHAVLFGQLRDA